GTGARCKSSEQRYGGLCLDAAARSNPVQSASAQAGLDPSTRAPSVGSAGRDRRRGDECHQAAVAGLDRSVADLLPAGSAANHGRVAARAGPAVPAAAAVLAVAAPAAGAEADLAPPAVVGVAVAAAVLPDAAVADAVIGAAPAELAEPAVPAVAQAFAVASGTAASAVAELPVFAEPVARPDAV